MAIESNTLFVQMRELEANYKQVESFQQAQARRARRTTRFALIIAGIMGLANLGLAWSVASLLPLSKLVPVYLLIRPDGTIDSSVSLSSLPASQNEAVIRAALWEYVRLREGYAYDTAQYNYDVVSAMSVPSVKTAYQSWFNYPNSASPQVVIGKNGNITIAPVSVAMLSAHVAQVRFARTVTMNGSKPVTKNWTATLAFDQVDALRAQDRLTDPAGVIITNYQAAEDSAP